MTLHVPEAWDLTGFSGDFASGYMRIDDSEEQGVEIKWAASPAAKRSAAKIDPVARRTLFLENLRRTARKKKLDFDSDEPGSYKPVERPDREVAPFSWIGDRRAVGAVWLCMTCGRVVIAQALGDVDRGKSRLTHVAGEVLGSLKCHGDDPGWRTWALYDLVTEVPSEYVLEGQQLMNIYLRLSFVARKTARLTVEQWALADVARKDAYLDAWLAANSKGDMAAAAYAGSESEIHGHPALQLTGRLAPGLGWTKAARQVARFQRPATRFSGVAWECEASNKLYLIQGMRPASAPDVAADVARRTRCHTGTSGTTESVDSRENKTREIAG